MFLQRSSFSEFKTGWLIVLGASLGVAVGVSSLPYYTSGIFLIELESEFGWSRSQLTTGVLLWTIMLALASPFVGDMIDKYGVRKPVAISLFSLAFVFILFGTVLSTYWQYLALYFAMSMFGAASSPLSFTKAVNSWFERSRGLALGLTLMGTGVTAAVVPRYLAIVIERHDWQTGYFFLAAIIVVALPFILFAVKLKPQSTEQSTSNVQDVFGLSLSEAKRTRVFWVLIVVFFLLAVAISGLLVHFVPLLVGMGVNKIEAASIAGLIGVSVISGRVIVGYLIDVFFAPRVAAITFSLCALGCLLLTFGGVSSAHIAAFAIGFGMGAEVDLIGYLSARYFGLKAYGKIYGFQYGAFILGAGIGPIWIGYSYDINGDYQIALLVSSLLLCAVAATFFGLPKFNSNTK